MCKAPIYLTSASTFVSCRVCSRCRSIRINDYVGRCLMEQETSDYCRGVTLTYRGDCVEAAILTYSHIQVMLRALRDAGYKVRYLCAGEYGELRNRAHWHITLFFSGKVPDLKEGKQEWKYWPHGHVFVQHATPKGFAYVCKYLVAPKKGPNRLAEQKRLSMSKKPPLGYQWLMNYAAQYVASGLEPTTYEYKFRDVKDAEGNPQGFWISGRSRELFMEEYLRLSGRDWVSYKSPLVLEYFDHRQRLLDAADTNSVFARMVAKVDSSRNLSPYIVPDPDDSEPVAWYRTVRDGDDAYLITGNGLGVCEVLLGDKKSWLVKKGELQNAQMRLELPGTILRIVAALLRSE